MTIRLSSYKTRQLGNDISGANNIVQIKVDEAAAVANTHMVIRIDAANTFFFSANGVGINVANNEGFSSAFPDSPIHVRNQGASNRSARFTRGTAGQHLDIIQNSTENRLESAVNHLVLAGGTVDTINVKVADRTPFVLPSFTTVQRANIVSPQNGMMIYNTTDNKVQVYENSAWANII